MEEKQLDYNQPFLSVRRFTSTVSSENNEKKKTNTKVPTSSSLPYYRSELKSGPVSNPGAVPFVWEKSPGRSKFDEPPNRSLDQLPIVPKLPPGRQKVSESSSPTSSKGRRFTSSSLSYSSLDEITEKIETSRDETEENKSSDTEDNNEAYQDALDTLSRTESFSLNCSLSGLSGVDDPDIKPSGTFSTDSQTRDFMMGRFLPAAKAMACDSPQSVYRKPAIVAKEQPQQFTDVMGVNKKPQVNRSRPNIVPNYAEVNVEEESEDEDYHDPGKLSSRGCGLLPRFFLLSPVPGLSVRTHAPKPPISRRQVRSSFIPNQKKEECTGSASLKQRSMEGNQIPELREHKQSTEGSNQKLDGRSLYRRLQGSSISTHENKLPHSRFYKEAEMVSDDNFNSEKRCTNTLEKLSGYRMTEKDIGSVTPMVEKTVYVDWVHKVASPNINSGSFHQKELKDSIKDDVEFSEAKGIETMPIIVSVCKGKEDPNTAKDNGLCEDKSVKASKLQSANLEVPNNNYVDTGTRVKPIKAERTENSSELDSLFLIPPPLPKSPTESWLWRTLPSMSTKNSTSHSSFGNKVNFQSEAPKWETIVKSSKV